MIKGPTNYHDELIILNLCATNNRMKNGWKTEIDISPEKTSRWPIGNEKLLITGNY